MIDVQQLEAFCAVVRSGSFSKAAAILSVGQPGLSRRIRRLEEQLGSQLFYRNGRGVALTDNGVQFHGKVSQLLAQLRAAYDEAADDGVTPIGSVTLGLPTSMSGLVGVPVLQNLKSECPGIKLHLIDGFSGHVNEWLVSGQIDLAILHQARHGSTIVVEHLLSEDLFLVGRDVPRRMVVTGSDPTIGLSELKALPLVVPGHNHGLRRQLDRISAQEGVELSIESEVDSLAAIKELIDGGEVYSVLPIGCVYKEVLAGSVLAWRITGPNIVNTMVLAAAQNRPYTAAMRKVRSTLREQIAVVASRQTGWSDSVVVRAPS